MDLPTPLGRRLSSLYFHLQRVEANFRFDLARIREYSEQIALLKSEPREMAHAAEVFDDVFRTIRRIIVVRTGLTAFNQFYSQLSVVIPYVIVRHSISPRRCRSAFSTRPLTHSAMSTRR